jgi:hypothetical protein
MMNWKRRWIRPFRPAAGICVRPSARLIVANEYLESEVGELMKAVSHGYTRGRFHSYSG